MEPPLCQCVTGVLAADVQARLLTYTLKTGLWGGSFPVCSPLPSNTKLGHFRTFPFTLFQPPTCRLYPCLSVQYFPVSVLPIHQHKVSPLSLSLFPPFPNLGYFFYLDTLVNLTQRCTDHLSYFFPALLSPRSKGSTGNKK